MTPSIEQALPRRDAYLLLALTAILLVSTWPFFGGFTALSVVVGLWTAVVLRWWYAVTQRSPARQTSPDRAPEINISAIRVGGDLGGSGLRRRLHRHRRREPAAAALVCPGVAGDGVYLCRGDGRLEARALTEPFEIVRIVRIVRATRGAVERNPQYEPKIASVSHSNDVGGCSRRGVVAASSDRPFAGGSQCSVARYGQRSRRPQRRQPGGAGRGADCRRRHISWRGPARYVRSRGAREEPVVRPERQDALHQG